MTTFQKQNVLIVVENISYIQEYVNGKNYVTMVNGLTIEVTEEELTEIKSILA